MMAQRKRVLDQQMDRHIVLDFLDAGEDAEEAEHEIEYE
jgi:hypothetical protein